MLKTEETLVIIKNKSISRGLVGNIIQIFENAGLQITRIKMLKPNKSQAKAHYQVDQNWITRVGSKALYSVRNSHEAEKLFGGKNVKIAGTKIYNWSIEQLIKVPIIVMTLKGTNAIEKVKKITGANEPAKADLSTIRGIFSSDSYIESNLQKRALYNVIHRSSNPKEAKREIVVWFSNKEL